MTHPDEQSEGLRNRLLDTVHLTVCGFNRNSFVVKAVLREVDIYSKHEKWYTLFGEDLAVLFDKLTVLAEPEEEDEDARRFDLFMLNFMLALVHRENTYFYAGDLQNIAKSLLRNISLPEIRQHEQILRFLVSDEFEPEHLDVYFLEEVRMELRQLVRLLEKEKRKPYIPILRTRSHKRRFRRLCLLILGLPIICNG